MNQFIAAATGWSDPTMIVTVLLLLGLIVMMLFSVRRRKAVRTQVEKMLDELRPGQRVRTVGGIIGRIKEIREESPAHTTEKGVVVPAVKTILLQTGNDKNPSYMLFDIQAVYGVIPEEGHTIEGQPMMKLPAPEEKVSDFNAREYVDSRNNLSKKGKKKTQ